MNDPNAQMGLQIGKTAMMTGAHYMEQNVRRTEYTPDALKADRGAVEQICLSFGTEALLQCL